MSIRIPRITPWRNHEELLTVRDDFFPAVGAPDNRPSALQKVCAWTVRSRIPHAIESTALLTDAALHDTPGFSQLHIRLSYSSAICRFVNGLLDPAQQSQFALPMHQLARNLGLPASFVEVRHAATHEELPSLCVLRKIVARALEWLWENYWEGIGDGGDGGEERRADYWKARELLKQWRLLRRDNTVKPIESEEKGVRQLIRNCIEACKEWDGAQGFVSALLEEKALVPKGKKKAGMMTGAISLWRPLLLAIGDSLDGFIEQLCFAILQTFEAQSSISGLHLEPSGSVPGLEERTTIFEGEHLEALLVWFIHLTSTTFRESSGSTLDVGSLTKQCLLGLNDWSIRAAEHLLSEYPSLKVKYEALAELASSQLVAREKSSKIKGVTNPRKRTLEDLESEAAASEEWLSAMCAQWANPNTPPPQTDKENPCKAGKWRRLGGSWKPKPMGVI